MSEIKQLTCLCCGAPINRAKKKCEYCGTEYLIEEDEDKVISYVETFQNPVREYTACTLIRRGDIAFGSSRYLEYAIRQLAEKMLPAVMEGMRIHEEYGPDLDTKKIIGDIQIVIPENNQYG